MKLIATDMDGTLVNQNREVTEENAKRIIEAQEKGIIVVVVTGRDYTEAVKPLKDVGIRCPIICVNGAETRTEEGEIVENTFLTLKQFRLIEECLKKNQIYFEIYTTKGSYTNDRQQALQLVVDVIQSAGHQLSIEQCLEIAERRFQNGEIIFNEDYDSIITSENVRILKVLAFSQNHNAREKAKAALMSDEYDLTISSSAHDNLEITNKDAKKGIALAKFALREGIEMKDVAAIGDNFNDISMLELAGMSIAMENAEPEVKEICSYETKSNDEHGVAYAIRNYILDK